MKWGFFIVILLSIGRFALSEDLLIVTENWRPFNYMENGQLKGTSTNIMKLVLQEAKLS